MKFLKKEIMVEHILLMFSSAIALGSMLLPFVCTEPTSPLVEAAFSFSGFKVCGLSGEGLVMVLAPVFYLVFPFLNIADSVRGYCVTTAFTVNMFMQELATMNLIKDLYVIGGMKVHLGIGFWICLFANLLTVLLLIHMVPTKEKTKEKKDEQSKYLCRPTPICQFGERKNSNARGMYRICNRGRHVCCSRTQRKRW